MCGGKLESEATCAGSDDHSEESAGLVQGPPRPATGERQTGPARWYTRHARGAHKSSDVPLGRCCEV